MKNYQATTFSGKRALFAEKNAHIKNSVFLEGESPLKESRHIQLQGSTFTWKYPLWYSQHVQVQDTIFGTMARSGIWYTKDIQIKNSTFQAPKNFRRSSDIVLDQVHFSDAEETLWTCENIKLTNVQVNGDYFGKDSKHIYIDHLDLVGNYAFDGAEDVEVHNSRLITKDAFWNCQHVTIYDSVISGEYLAWNTKDITLINCRITSNQGLCDIDNLTMKNCQLINSELTFEYCSQIDAQISSDIVSVKNPISGHIQADSIGELILDPECIDPAKTVIETKQPVLKAHAS